MEKITDDFEFEFEDWSEFNFDFDFELEEWSDLDFGDFEFELEDWSDLDFEFEGWECDVTPIVIEFEPFVEPQIEFEWED